MSHRHSPEGATSFPEQVSERETNRFLEWLTIEIAPTIRGSKPSTLLSLVDTKEQAVLTIWRQHGSQALNNTLVQFLNLRWSPNRETVLFYRPDILEQCITNDHHRWFLKKLGYPVEAGVTACLALLQERFQHCCPHEIGLLLGIPLQDVLGFMAMTDLPQTCRKKWCIYGNPDESLAVIRKFAADRSAVSCLLAEGMTVYEIMCGTVMHIA